jgi:ubiquinone/menaquinone biosynthesis C-methylase UbiE
MTPSELQHQVAERSVGIYEASGPRVHKVRKVLASFGGRQKMLDVGCADGALVAPLTQVHEVHGVEISEGLAARAAKAGLKTKVHDLETQPLPYEDKTFDVAFSGENIEHVVDTDWMVSEVNRVLKAGGTFVLTFPNIRTLLSLGMMAFLDMPPMYSARYRSPHFRDFTLRTIKMVLQNHGFAVQKTIGCSFFLPKIGEFGAGVATFFPSWANTTIVVSQKIRDSVYAPELSMGEIFQ